MEEKERCVIGKGEDIFIADNDRKVMFTITKKKLQDLLNQQDKELSKLRASYQQVKEENHQLKQQLHDLPKKIVREIRTHFLYGVDGETTGIDIILDTILKKYGEGK